jgi:glutamate synthase (NADPH/NADH) small chain
MAWKADAGTFGELLAIDRGKPADCATASVCVFPHAVDRVGMICGSRWHVSQNHRTHHPVLCSELEAFTMNYDRRKQGYVIPVGTPTGRKVAVLGMGSAGFGCAETLVQKGHEVTIFDTKPAKEVLEGTQKELELAGVKFLINNDIGKDKTFDWLFEEGFDAVFIDVGFGIGAKMKDTPGTDLSGVYKAADFLICANMEPNRLLENKHEPLEIGRRVVVIGGGDSTPDCLQTALKLGSEDVTCLYQHSEDEMPVEKKGQAMVRVEGAKYRFLTQPVKFIAGSDGKLAAVECVELKPGEPDAQGRLKLIPVEGSNFSVAADTAILSKITPDIDNDMIDASEAPSRAGIFTAEDYVQGSDFAVAAMKDGRKTALAIDTYLKSKK